MGSKADNSGSQTTRGVIIVVEWAEEFFTSPRLTSKLKHLVLRRYVKEFAYHLGSTNPTVYYIDGFAGRGVYADPPHEDGSPLLIARLAREVRTGPNAVTLRCINIEADAENFESLETATQDFMSDVVVRNIHSGFADAIPEILDIIGDSAAFFFIDPFGTKDIAFKSLLPIFTRKPTTEALITLHTDGIAKKAGWFAKLESDNSRERSTAQKLTGHLAAALDIPSEKLRRGWDESREHGGTPEFEQRVQRWYTRRLKSRTTSIEYSKAFKVLYRPEPRSSVCFHLVFGTRSFTGLEKMNNAMAAALDAFYADVYHDTLFPEHASEREQEIGREAVRRGILSEFRSQPFTIEQVKQHFMQETDYVLRAGEYRKPVLEMLRTRQIERTGTGPVKNASKFRVLSARPS